MARSTRSWLHVLVLALAAGACGEVTGTPSPRAGNIGIAATTGNPMLPGDTPDPHIAVLDGKYWLYPTGGGQFRAYSSFDLTNWVDEGVVLDLGPGVSWTDRNGWAPAIVFRNGKYYFYYSANGPAPDSKIGVAVGNSPRGPFTDKGVPLVHSTSTVEAIDPMVFVDDDGQAYLYYGGSAGSNLAIVKLNSDMTSLAGTPVVRTPSYFTEAPFMHKPNGIYYMTYSNGRWYDRRPWAVDVPRADPLLQHRGQGPRTPLGAPAPRDGPVARRLPPTARQNQCCVPPIRTVISSRCHTRPGRASRLRSWEPDCGPNVATQQRSASYVTPIPRSASISSTSRKLKGKRR